LWAGSYAALAILRTTGSAPARIVTEPGDANHGRTIAPGATLQLEPKGRTVRVVCDTTTTVEVTCFALNDLKADAADRCNLPVELLGDDRSMADIADTVVRFTRFVRGKA
jgi:hypothetical protein